MFCMTSAYLLRIPSFPLLYLFWGAKNLFWGDCQLVIQHGKWMNMAQSWRISCTKTVDDDVFSMTMLNYVKLREDNGIPWKHYSNPQKNSFQVFPGCYAFPLVLSILGAKNPEMGVHGIHHTDLGDLLPCLELGIGQPNNAADEENVHHHLLHQNLPRSQVTIVTKVFPQKSWPKIGTPKLLLNSENWK